MEDCSIYYLDKESIKNIAFGHTTRMNQMYSKDILNSYNNSTIYGPDSVFYYEYDSKYTSIIVEDIDTVSGIFKHKFGKTAVLNFASYKNPGGRFLDGSTAQEEYLCHHSFLYNVLEKFGDYYQYNNMNKNRALYHNRAIYTPNIMFTTPNMPICFYCDVITCAAPNKSVACRYKMATPHENTIALSSRIRFILNIAAEQKVDTLILGAFGCGVFGQDPIETAEIFKQYLSSEFKNVFGKVIFAIPRSNKSVNYNAFYKVFNS